MIEVTKLSITESSNKGFSYVTRTANEEGIVMITKNDEPYALVLPTTARGLHKFNKKFENAKIEDIPIELRYILLNMIALTK